MSSLDVLDRFIKSRPLCVMTRCILGHLVHEGLDAVFAKCRRRQYEEPGGIKFSALATSVADINLGFCENPNQAYKQHQDRLGTSRVAYYAKLNHVETSTSEGVVQYSHEKTAELLHEIGAGSWEVLKGYKCSVLDGNHLQKTEKRLGVLRGLCAAALPGTAVAKFDLQDQVFERAYLLEDGHAQESQVLDRVVADLAAKELLIADRHFCIVKFVLDVIARDCCFVIRQHGRLKGKLLGKRRKIGRSESGVVYEQSLQIPKSEAIVRRITVELDTPTREGDTEIHILSNVPEKDATACQLADLYHQRWEIENAFHVLTMTLTCELKSLAHPRAALFLFSMALLAYNCRQVLYAALWAEHEAAEVEAMSQHAVSLEIERAMDGLVTAIPESEWDEIVPPTVKDRVAFLRRVSRHVDVRSYRKSVRGPKKPKPPRKRCKAGTHVSTHRELQKQRP